MADIRQAAQWMKDGKKVARPGFLGYFFRSDFFIHYRGNTGRRLTDMLDTVDLLADDWEVVNGD